MLIVTILHPTYNNSIRDAQTWVTLSPWPTFFLAIDLPCFTIIIHLTAIPIRDAQIWPTFFSTSPTELSLPTFRVLAPSQPRLGYHKQGESIYFQIFFSSSKIKSDNFFDTFPTLRYLCFCLSETIFLDNFMKKIFNFINGTQMWENLEKQNNTF